MRPEKWIELEELRQPAIRRILEAIKAIEEERPGLVQDAALAAGELAKRRGDGGRMPE
jgi:hypothetical protein